MAIERSVEEQPLSSDAEPDRPLPDPATHATPHVTHLQQELLRLQQALAESQKSEQILAGLIESAMDAIISVDESQRIVLFNPAAEQMFGLAAAAALQQSIEMLLPEASRQKHADHIRAFAHSGESRRRVVGPGCMHGRRANGEIFPVEASISQIQVQDHRLFTVILRDITKRKRIEQALRDSQSDFGRAQHLGRIGSWRLDTQRNELHWSDEIHRIFGIPKGVPITYETFLATLHPDDRAYVDAKWQACLQGEPYDIEHRLEMDGQVKWVREKAELEFDEQGQLLGGFGIAQDITDIKLAEQALRESEARFQLATEIGRSGTWDWDAPTGRIIWSRGHYEILGYSVGEVPPSYQAWVDRVHPEDLSAIEAETQRSMAEHRDYVVEFRVVWPDGSVHWMSSRGRYEYGADGSCSRMIGVMADVTTLKQAEFALIEADQRKNEFLAMLAHELRNPLTPIRNAAHVLGRLEVREPRVQWAQQTIERQVSHLTRLVDDLLDVSRIVRGKVELKKEPVELAAVVNQALDMARPLLDTMKHRITVRLPEQPVQLHGDPVRLAQVLLNLLDNAAHYTPEGGRIEVEARLAGPLVEIRVRDNGVGIETDLLPHIFDLFQQGERSLDRRQGGLGIGLTLVKQLVEMHGGQVDVASAGVDQGASFTLWLPLPDNTAAPTAHTVQKASTATVQCRVLVVDDDAAVADSMTVLLQLEGYEVKAVASGEAALQLARSFQPQLVLLDIGLQGMDGYEVARQLRAQQVAGERVFLVAVTGYGHEAARSRSLDAGFDQHLVKPVCPKSLLELIAGIQGTQTGDLGKPPGRT
jgi:PAS domain S-box-containing protein